MKKTLLVLFVVFLAVCSVFAGDFKFLATDGGVHPEVVGGFVPVLAVAGVSYEGFQFIDGNLTQLQATVGGGYLQRVLFQDPQYGTPITDDLLIFDQWQVRWNLKLQQGFGQSWVEGKDLITAYVGYEGRYELSKDSLAVGKERARGAGGKTAVPTIKNWIDEHGGNKIYPEFMGDDYSALINYFYAGAKLNMMEDKMVSNRGFLAEISFQYAPNFLNKKASYFSATINAEVGTTLMELPNKKGDNLFSIVLLDRVNASWTSGSMVPAFAVNPVSLGRKVRGFEAISYATNFTIVNNFEVRFAGPDIFVKGIFPRINVFFDAGWYAGNYLNTGNDRVDAVGADYPGMERLLLSTGVQVEVCFFDFIDLGIQLAFPLKGVNIRYPENKLIFGVTFFLDL